jgi:hypothetical protein
MTTAGERRECARDANSLGEWWSLRDNARPSSANRTPHSMRLSFRSRLSAPDQSPRMSTLKETDN